MIIICIPSSGNSIVGDIALLDVVGTDMLDDAAES